MRNFESYLLISNYKAIDGYDFAWTDGATAIGITESITVSASGTYALGVNKGNCQGATTVLVTVHDLPTVVVDDEVVIEDETTDNITESNVVHTDNDNNVVEEDVKIRRSDQEIINIVDSNSVLLYNRNQNKSSSESDYEEWDDLSESKILNIIGDYEK